MNINEQRIKIALQKSGRLANHSLDLLTRCGLKFSQSKDQLVCYGENMPVDLLLVRDDDIPGLVHDNTCDLGIAGFNVVEERRLAYLEKSTPALYAKIFSLDFGHCHLAIAVPDEFHYVGMESLAGTRIATSYPATLAAFLQNNNISAEIVTFSGAVEIAPKLGNAEIVCDLVSSGATLLANQLREVETILSSEAVIIQSSSPMPEHKQDWIDKILERLDGVLQVRESKYVMLHAPVNRLEQIVALLPGSESPTIIPLGSKNEKVAVHAVCRETVFWETLESLKSAGASSLLVLPVEKMLA